MKEVFWGNCCLNWFAWLSTGFSRSMVFNASLMLNVLKRCIIWRQISLSLTLKMTFHLVVRKNGFEITPWIEVNHFAPNGFLRYLIGAYNKAGEEKIRKMRSRPG